LTPRRVPEGRPASPVTTFAQLIERAHAVEGIPLADLAAYLEYPLRDPSRFKGYVGNLMQLAFGRRPDSRPEADLDRFRIEVKTVPVDNALKALENTRVTKINPTNLCGEANWTRSHLFQKITTILLVPIVKEPRPSTNVGAWRARSPFVWMPSKDEMTVLESDWLTVQDRYRAGDVTDSAISGEFTLANTQSTDSSVREQYTTALGVTKSVKPKAFYLRNSTVTRVLRETISWEALIARPARTEGDTIVAASEDGSDF
jgi:DNA mismatch repair protein MutH